MSLLPSKIITPVVGIEESKGEGESNPGDDVDLLCLEVEVFVPLNQGVRLPSWSAAVNNWAWWRRRVVGTVSTLGKITRLQIWIGG